MTRIGILKKSCKSNQIKSTKDRHKHSQQRWLYPKTHDSFCDS
jgi:hypothetical protein